MDQAIRLKKGKMGIVVKQCDSRGRVRMLVDVPFPCEVLNILGRVAIGDEPRDGIFRDDIPPFFAACGDEFFLVSPDDDFLMSDADDFLVAP